MSNEVEIRESLRSDIAAIESLYPEAFPDEDLLPVVRDLLHDPAIMTSLVGLVETAVVGHAIFTYCGIGESDVNAALLGPLAVAPKSQQRGIGSALVRAGLERMKGADVTVVCVLGDPAYYGRFGFVKDSLIEPPYPLPAEWSGAWQSLYLDDKNGQCAGILSVPPQWQQPALWVP